MPPTKAMRLRALAQIRQGLLLSRLSQRYALYRTDKGLQALTAPHLLCMAMTMKSVMTLTSGGRKSQCRAEVTFLQTCGGWDLPPGYYEWLPIRRLT